MNSKPVVDQNARETALDVTRSFIVQAPAGSGKTGLLTQRLLSLLALADEPEEVLAITFTHKAAGEMRNRILASLQRAKDETPPANPHELTTWELARKVLAQSDRKQWDLSNSSARLRVQTIDSLCASLTRQMPLLSAFGTQPAVTEDAARLYAEAARNTLADIENGAEWSPHIEHLLKHLDNNLHRVEELLAAMLGRRDHWLRHIGDRQDERLLRSSLEKVLHRIVEEHLRELRDSVPTELADELVALAAFAAEKLQEQGIDSLIHACSGLHRLPGCRVAHLPVWQGVAQLLLTHGNWRKEKGINKNQGFPPSEKENKQRMQKLLSALQVQDTFRSRLAGISDLPHPVYSEKQWDILEALIELLPVAVGHLEVVFGSHGQVDFTEIAQRAVQALGADEQPTDLALALDYRIRHILVDEFQDTSLSQYQLLERLTAGWTEGDGRSLFLVGDPMQSIYRFREAEVALFLRARKHGIGSVKLAPLTLSVNFRSQAPLVDWFNNIFQQVFPQNEDLTTGAVTYTDSNAFHADGNGNTASIEPLFSEDPVQEANRVVDVIQRERDERPDDTIAILVRARNHLQSIARTLTDAGIGFRAVEIERLATRQVVIDMMTLTRALMHAGDRVAWIAMLRAPWCGLGLADIEKLLSGNSETPVWQIISESTNLAVLTAEDRTRLSRMVKVLDHAIWLRQSVPLSERVEGAWLALGGPATLERHQDLSDCEQYLRLLRSMEADAVPITVSSLQKGIDSLFASTDPDSDVHLQVMTIHKAKGLEFDTVILPGLGRKPPPNGSHLLNWAERAVEEDRSELILAPIAASGEDRDAINGYLQNLERTREFNETSRLLYVAATRAKRRLYLFGNTKPKTDGQSVMAQPPVKGSLLSTLWPAVESIFVDAAVRFDQQQESAGINGKPTWLDVQGVSRLPASWSSPVEFERDLVKSQGQDEEPVEYSWVGPSARHVGTLVHRLLESIVSNGIRYWPTLNSDIGRANVRSELMSLGVGSADLDVSVDTVMQAIKNTLEDERGLWILDNFHQGSRCEYALQNVEENRTLVTSVIDRTFIDSEGVRWIIDYKTSSHSGGGAEEFLDREMERYRAQLGRYAKVFRQLENRPIKLGLYFPLLSGWREWDYVPD